MIKLLHVLLTQPYRLNEVLRRPQPSYRQLFFRLVVIMMLPILLHTYQITEHVKKDIGEMHHTIPAFTLKEGHLAWKNAQQKPYVFLGDYFNVIFNPSQEPVHLSAKDNGPTVVFSRDKVTIDATNQSFYYKDYPQLTADLLREAMLYAKEGAFEYMLVVVLVSFVLCYLSMILLQFVYRTLLTLISTSMGVLVVPFALRRLTASISILPISLVAIGNCFSHGAWSYFGVGFFLFGLTTYYVFAKTRKHQQGD